MKKLNPIVTLQDEIIQSVNEERTVCKRNENDTSYNLKQNLHQRKTNVSAKQNEVI